MVRQTATVITFELLGGVLLLAVAAVVTLAFMLAQGPVKLNIFKADVERALEEARNGRDVAIEDLTLQWSPSDRRVIVSANNLSLADSSGQPAAHADQALITLDAGSLFFGRTEILRTELRDGWVDVRNESPTLWTFAGEPLPEFEARELPQSVDGWLSLFNRVLGDVLVGIEATRREGTLEAASFERMDLRFYAANDTLTGEMNNASGSLERNQQGLRVTLAGSGGGVGLPGDIDSELVVPADYGSLSLRLDVLEWSVGDLAERLGMFEDRVNGFPADIGLTIDFSASDGLTDVTLDAIAGSGEILIAGRPQSVDSLEFETSYDPRGDELDINRLEIASQRLTGTWSGTVTQPTSEATVSSVNLEASALKVDLTPYFPEAWDLTDIEVEGEVDLDDRTASIERFVFSSGRATFEGTTEIESRADVDDGQLPFEMDLQAEMAGTLDKTFVLKFWPRQLSPSARRFAVERIQSVRATAASVNLGLKPDSIQDGYLRDEDIEVRFFVADAQVKFMDSLPPVTQASGSARLTGNGFSVQLNSGEYGGWPISEGSVTVPRFNSDDEGRIRVFARGAGPVVDAMRNLANSRLLDDGTDLKPERFSGDASMTFEMFMPMRNEIDDDEFDITLTGDVANARLKDALPGLDLENGQVEVNLSDNRLVLTGFGDLGPAPVQFTWRDDLDDDGAPANLSASSFISPDFLNRFGVVGRAYLSGDIPVELQALVAATGVRRLDISFDLQQARVDVSELGWVKSSGDPARASLSYGEGDQMTASTFQFRSEDARFDGDVRVSEEGQLQSLEVREAYLEDFIDVSGEIIRQDDNSYETRLSGAFIDASAFFGDFGNVDGNGGGFGVPLTLDASIERLRLRDAIELRDATLRFESTRAGVKEVTARGAIGSGEGAVSATYVGPTAKSAGRVRVESDDAGFIMRALIGEGFLSGGSLLLDGQLARGNTPAQIDIQLNDVRMRDAPLVTQVLSLASLRGLSDTLSGEGVLFTNVRIPVTMLGDRFVIDGAAANGPALGLTLNGWIGRTSDDIRVSGVLVPSFGMNSMLGGVPIIGDLFVGRDGEGIFSLTYSVRGTLERAQVAINPLSAVTPGILRRIFENPADTTIPDSLPTDPGRTPPAPPMPDAEFIPSAPGSDKPAN